MQRIAFATATAALLALGLTGCFSGTPTSAESPLPSTRPSATASASATPTATPSQTATVAPAPDPQPTENPGQSNPNPNPGTGDAVPAKWSDDELLGACKEAWTESGEVSDWSDYSPDARIEQRGAGHYVAISSETGGAVRDCTINGTPSEPSVVLGS
jgi:hypothetical protein